MQILTNSNKCLFGGALVAAGLATHKAHAQEFLFIDSTASASTVGVADTFNGPGTWSVEAHYSYFGYGDAAVWGMPTSLGLSAYGSSDTGTPTADASAVSRFTVTSDTSATLDTYLWGGYGGAFDSNLTFTDITTGVELFSVNGFDIGLYEFDLLADHEYRFSSATNNGWATLTIPERCPADLNSDGVLNFFDVSAFLVAFGAMDPIADFNNDGAFNFFDVSAFLAAFAAGCP